MSSYRCLVITKFEKRESPEKLKEEVTTAMEGLLAGGAAAYGWQEAHDAPKPEDVVPLKDWNAPTASQVEAVVLPNGDVHVQAPVVGERPSTVLKGGAELRKYDAEAWSHFLDAEAKIRHDKIAVKITFDDRNNLLEGTR